MDLPVAAGGQAAVVGDQQQRRPGSLPHREQQIDHRLPGGVVQIAGWFVGQKQCRFGGEGARQGGALLLAAGKLAGKMGQAVAQSDGVQGGTGAGAGVAVADWINVPLLYFERTGKAPQRMGLAHPSICPYGAFGTRDGALVLISIQNEREWVTFCASFLDEPELPRQPGFESNTVRVANRAVVDERVGRAFAALTRDAAAAKLRASNTAYGFVNDLAALGQHPALRRTTVALPGGGVADIVAPAVIRVGETLALGAVPAVGQDSAAIRAEFSV